MVSLRFLGMGSVLVCLWSSAALAGSYKRSELGDARYPGCAKAYLVDDCSSTGGMTKDVCPPMTNDLYSAYAYSQGAGGGWFFKPANTCASHGAGFGGVNCSDLCTALNYVEGGSCDTIAEMSCLGATITDVGYCNCQEDPMENGDEVETITIETAMEAEVNRCVPVTIETEGIGGQQSVGGTLTVKLYAGTDLGYIAPAHFPFFSDSSCSTNIFQTTIEDGTSSRTVYFLIGTAGTYTLSAVINGLAPNWTDILITNPKTGAKSALKKHKVAKKIRG